MLNRRNFVALAAGWPLLQAQAQVVDLSDAINKAGRQRMLSQRMGKAWLAMVHGVEVGTAQQVLDKSMLQFDRQLADLKAYAPDATVLETYTQLDAAWNDYKLTLVSATPSKERAAKVLQLDARVLALAHKGTLQYEAVMGKPLGKLVNIAGRQRMLTQRMAKFYYAAKLPVDANTAATEIGKARSEFITAMATLRNAPEATQRIRDELQLADGQWVFFDVALQRLHEGQIRSKAMSEVFVASENLLSVMDSVTELYSAIKV
jgi:hypothetical protein